MCRDVTKSGSVMWRRDKTKSKVCFQVEWKLWGSDEEMYSFFSSGFQAGELAQGVLYLPNKHKYLD